jgi:hypothetical protein
MQNRESAVRSRQKKKEGLEHIKIENDVLTKENSKLYHENVYLKKENNFLIDQIKFMQNLIKSNGLHIKGNKTDSDLENNIKNENKETTGSTIGFSGRHRTVGKMFSVFIVCILSVFYISSNNVNGPTESISFNLGTMSLNDDSDRVNARIQNKSIFCFENIFKIAAIALVSIFILNINHIWNWVKIKYDSNDKKLK